ncbi:transposase [Streptomyces sp. NPDC048577]|uniref:transposase n=1 Tax=unclassified Streptomyces TaxID=2593676 RepID=UPI00342EEEB3
MGSKDTNRYSAEYERDAIELVRSSGRTVTKVARELGISSKSLRGWVKKARAAQDNGSGPGAVRAVRTSHTRSDADHTGLGRTTTHWVDSRAARRRVAFTSVLRGRGRTRRCRRTGHTTAGPLRGRR